MRKTKLTEKMKAFCREYVSNGGNGTQAYLTAYDSKNPQVAANESNKLLYRDDITEYIKSLNKPLENRITSEREKKRRILWDFIENNNVSDNDRLKALDLLNKMDSEYVNINRNIEQKADISTLDADTLKKLSNGI